MKKMTLMMKNSQKMLKTEVIDYWPMFIIEPKVNSKKKQKSSVYRDSKIGCHKTTAGVGIVGKLLKKG